MNQKVREPFIITRIVNLILGLIILALIVVVLVKKTDTEIFKMLIFVLAAVENFIGATISFPESKRIYITTTFEKRDGKKRGKCIKICDFPLSFFAILH